MRPTNCHKTNPRASPIARIWHAPSYFFGGRVGRDQMLSSRFLQWTKGMQECSLRRQWPYHIPKGFAMPKGAQS